MGLTFSDRRSAGRQLAELLAGLAHRDDVVVLGLPRGGVPVAAAVADKLDAPLDVFVVRKLGLPGHEELAMGAVASGGATVRNERVLSEAGVSAAAFDEVRLRELAELARREKSYRGGRAPLDVAGKTVVVVDDGLATGATMRAAVAALHHLRPATTVVAVPVAASQTRAELRADVDDLICLHVPDDFYAVGSFYLDFSPTTDDEVRQLLAAARPPD